jgi:hypothetical protein
VGGLRSASAWVSCWTTWRARQVNAALLVGAHEHVPQGGTRPGPGYWPRRRLLVEHAREICAGRQGQQDAGADDDVTSTPAVQASASIGPWPSTAQRRAAYLEAQISRCRQRRPRGALHALEGEGSDCYPSSLP